THIAHRVVLGDTEQLALEVEVAAIAVVDHLLAPDVLPSGRRSSQKLADDSSMLLAESSEELAALRRVTPITHKRTTAPSVAATTTAQPLDQSEALRQAQQITDELTRRHDADMQQSVEQLQHSELQRVDELLGKWIGRLLNVADAAEAGA